MVFNPISQIEAELNPHDIELRMYDAPLDNGRMFTHVTATVKGAPFLTFAPDFNYDRNDNGVFEGEYIATLVFTPDLLLIEDANQHVFVVTEDEYEEHYELMDLQMYRTHFVDIVANSFFIIDTVLTNPSRFKLEVK